MFRPTPLGIGVTPILLLALAPSVPALAAPITVVASAPTTFIENPNTNPLTTVTFTVTNTAAQAYILDFALEEILWPTDPDDQVANNGTSLLPTFIPAATALNPTPSVVFSYQVYNPRGNPIDCCDNGVNPIDFFIEVSPLLTQPTQATIMTNGYGTFVVPTNGSSTGTENLAQYNAFLNCFNTGPANCLPVAQNGTMLFSNGIDGIPYPAMTSVTVVDTPEPAAGCLCAAGCALLVTLRKWARSAHTPRTRAAAWAAGMVGLLR
jgi:hypothetical protein